MLFTGLRAWTTEATCFASRCVLAVWVIRKRWGGLLRDMDSRLVIQAGGLPIRIGGALVGGIGVGGAPSGAIDETCARAGLDAIGAE